MACRLDEVALAVIFAANLLGITVTHRGEDFRLDESAIVVSKDVLTDLLLCLEIVMKLFCHRRVHGGLWRPHLIRIAGKQDAPNYGCGKGDLEFHTTGL